MSDSMKDIIINSLQNLYDVLENELNSFINNVWKPNYKIYYRGQANSIWDIRSTIMREHTIKGFQKIVNGELKEEIINIESEGLYIFESNMIHEVKKNYPDDFRNLSHIQVLSKMQHHGLPTRLIDITSNPLVAMFFACNDFKEREKDGAIYIFYDSPHLQGETFIEDAVSWSFSKKDGRPTTPSFIIDPDYDHLRIKSQQGGFIWENTPEETSRLIMPLRMIIPSSSKRHIIQQLDKAGINLSSLFPDLDNLILRVKEKYIRKFAEEIKKVNYNYTFSGYASPTNPLSIQIGFNSSEDNK